MPRLDLTTDDHKTLVGAVKGNIATLKAVEFVDGIPDEIAKLERVLCLLQKQEPSSEVTEKDAVKAALPKDFPETTKRRIVDFVARMNQEFAAHSNYIKKYYVAGGRKYVKIAQTKSNGQNCVVCFLDSGGNIWRAESWKKPALNKPRGSIFEDNFSIGNGIDRYGATYLI